MCRCMYPLYVHPCPHMKHALKQALERIQADGASMLLLEKQRYLAVEQTESLNKENESLRRQLEELQKT